MAREAIFICSPRVESPVKSGKLVCTREPAIFFGFLFLASKLEYAPWSIKVRPGTVCKVENLYFGKGVRKVFAITVVVGFLFVV